MRNKSKGGHTPMKKLVRVRRKRAKRRREKIGFQHSIKIPSCHRYKVRSRGEMSSTLWRMLAASISFFCVVHAWWPSVSALDVGRLTAAYIQLHQTEKLASSESNRHSRAQTRGRLWPLDVRMRSRDGRQ